MTTQEPPKLEYPCDYPIKVMGLNESDFARAIIEVIRRHDPGFNAANVALRASRNEKYLSVTATITATSPEQIADLFQELKATGRVEMVL
jgi:putative lipoic acid-binding regulatory protein